MRYRRNDSFIERILCKIIVISVVSMSTEGTDPQKLLRKLSAVASFLDSGETTSRLFHVRRPIRSKYLDTKRFFSRRKLLANRTHARAQSTWRQI